MSVIGIDLGNDTCKIGMAARGGIDIILNESSNRKNPTLVSERRGGRGGGWGSASCVHVLYYFLYLTYWYSMVLCCIVLYCSVLFCIVLCCFVLCCFVLYSTVLYCVLLSYAILPYCALLHPTVLYVHCMFLTVLYRFGKLNE